MLLTSIAIGATAAPDPGVNPQPIQLVRPQRAPLSSMALLGRDIFFDRSLSSSRARSCADCHSPEHAFGPPSSASVMDGGPSLQRPGLRAVPSLMYLERQPNFSLGPDNPEAETVPVAQAGSTLVPQGGLFWDGRADTLQSQAEAPLLDPDEMDGGSITRIAATLQHAAYAPKFAQLFGATMLKRGSLLVDEALFAIARYQIEEPAFHPYRSKYDAWLEGKAALTPAELRGYRLFTDTKRANCIGCHLAAPTADDLPPLFTDHQYEALGVPRNRTLAVNRNPGFADLGICGPKRTDMRTQTHDCGMFATPTLRNVATRHVFFHNGVYHTLRQVLDFYNERDTEPQKIYPRAPDGTVEQYDDLPRPYRRNVDVVDAPFGRTLGERNLLSSDEEDDIIAFIDTLTDGYRSEHR